jgi:hypothetical protein
MQVDIGTHLSATVVDPFSPQELQVCGEVCRSSVSNPHTVLVLTVHLIVFIAHFCWLTVKRDVTQ